MSARPALLVLPLAAVVALAACDTGDGKELQAPTSDQRAVMSTTTTSTTTLPASDIGVLDTTTLAPTTTIAAFGLQLPWEPGAPIDARFTCDGADRSPGLTWTAPPAGTIELALLVTDDDAAGFVHWAVAGIPASAGEVGEGGQITGAIEGRNDFDELGWNGPCPPAGGPHTYRFTLYALTQQAELPEGFTGDDLTAVAGPANIGAAQSSGVYTRTG